MKENGLTTCSRPVLLSNPITIGYNHERSDKALNIKLFKAASRSDINTPYANSDDIKGDISST